MKRFVLYILLLCCAGAQAQSVQQIEQEIQAHLNHIQFWKFEYSPEDTVFKMQVNPEDSLLKANIELENYLLNIGRKQPASLRAKITLPENSDMKIVSSDDGVIRVYSWDTHIAEHPFGTIIQFESGAGVKTIAIMDLKTLLPKGKIYQRIFTVAANSGRKYYLMVSSKPTSENNVEKEIEVQTIIGDKLQTADVLAGSSSKKYEYNYSSNYDFRKMREEYDLRYEKGKLYIPQVRDYKMTGRYDVYNFDGEKFVLDAGAK